MASGGVLAAWFVFHFHGNGQAGDHAWPAGLLIVEANHELLHAVTPVRKLQDPDRHPPAKVLRQIHLVRHLADRIAIRSLQRDPYPAAFRAVWVRADPECHEGGVHGDVRRPSLPFESGRYRINAFEQ